MMRYLILILLCSCSLAPGVTPQDPTCRFYDEANLGFQAVAVTMGGVAGATGSGGALVGYYEDDEDWTVGLAVTSAASAVIAATATMLAGEYAQRYAEQCSGGE